MKRKVTAIAVCVAMLAIAVIGGTLAYFTDTDNAKNAFTTGDVKIELVEKNADGTPFTQDQKLLPGSKTENNIAKVVTVENKGTEDAYMWIEVWVPAALDDGDDNSPTAPGLGNSLHFNYGKNVTETKSTFLGSKEIEGVSYNGYVHFVENDAAKASGESTVALLNQVYMDKKVTQCEAGHEGCLVLADGKTHYTGSWDLVVNAIGFQADGVGSIESAINNWYGKNVADHLW